MRQCECCKKEYSDKLYRFAVVEIHSKEIDRSTKWYVGGTKETITTRIYERVVGFDRICICDDCIKKERNKVAVDGVITTALFSIFFIVMGRIILGYFKLWFITAFVLGMLLGTIASFIYSRSNNEAFVASRVRRIMIEKASKVRYHFVPMDSSLYCPIRKKMPLFTIFKEKSGLKTKVADELFKNIVLPGDGNKRVDEIIDFKK